MKQSTIALLILLAPVAWLLFRPRLTVLKSRFARAMRIGFVVYFGLMFVRIAQSGVDENEFLVATLSLLIFGALWLLAWVATARIEKNRGRE